MGLRWVIVMGALAAAGIAIYVLLMADGREGLPEIPPGSGGPALDEIDAKSRAAMRDLLREAGDEE